MKNILLALLLILMPINAYAAKVDYVDYDIEDVYINATVDIFGSIHVEEAIIVNGSLNGFERVINYKNSNLKEYEEGNIDFSNSSIYNGRAMALSRVSSFTVKSDEIGWEVLSTFVTDYEEVSTASSGDTGVFTKETGEDGITVRVYNPNKSGYVVYYFDYYIDQAVVLHNDVAELYWQFIPLDFDYINKAHIQVLLPGSCTDETFRFWAHGPLNGSIGAILADNQSEDGKNLYRGILANVESIDGSGTDIRVTFDKSMMSMAEAFLNKSNEDALDKIIEVETIRADDANQKRAVAKTVYYGIYILSGAYLLGIVILWIYMYKKYDKEYKVDFNAKYYREFTGDYGVEVIDYLLNKKVSTNAMSASIMNLIYKKNIEIIENANDKKNPTLKLISEENLSESEKIIIELLFKTISTSGEVSIKDIEKYSKKYSTAEKFMKKYDYWVEKVKEEAEREEFFEDHTSKRLIAGLYNIMGIIIILLMFIFNMINPIILTLILIMSISFTIYIASFKKWTKKGREHYLKWNAFKNFLKDFGSFKEKELPEIKLWEKYLVYATIFGLAKTVEKTMKLKLTEFGYDEQMMYSTSHMYRRDYFIGNIISDSIHKSHANSLSTISAATATSSSSSGGGFGGGFSSGGGFGGGGGGGHGF